jgi:hypothetical protein
MDDRQEVSQYYDYCKEERRHFARGYTAINQQNPQYQRSPALLDFPIKDLTQPVC